MLLHSSVSVGRTLSIPQLPLGGFGDRIASLFVGCTLRIPQLPLGGFGDGITGPFSNNNSGGQAVRPHRRYDRTGNGRPYEVFQNWFGGCYLTFHSRMPADQ